MKQVFDIIGQEVREGDYVAISESTYSTHGVKMTIYKVKKFRETPKQLIMECCKCGYEDRLTGKASFRPLEWGEHRMIRLTDEQLKFLSK